MVKDIEKRKKQQKKYYDTHRNEIDKYQRQYHEARKEDYNRKNVCRILKKHEKDLKDDPERLSTEFLQKMIGIECIRLNLK